MKMRGKPWSSFGGLIILKDFPLYSDNFESRSYNEKYRYNRHRLWHSITTNETTNFSSSHPHTVLYHNNPIYQSSANQLKHQQDFIIKSNQNEMKWRICNGIAFDFSSFSARNWFIVSTSYEYELLIDESNHTLCNAITTGVDVLTRMFVQEASYLNEK